MIDQTVMEQYIEEPGVKIVEGSKTGSENLITKFFCVSPKEDFSKLSKADFIKMYSSLDVVAKSSFATYRSKIADFYKWAREHGYNSDRALSELYSVEYSDINRLALYDTYYFRDITDLWDTLRTIFEYSASEFDTFQVAVLLTYVGIDFNYLPDLLKTALNEDDMTVTDPSTSKKLSIPDCDVHDAIFSFLINYRDAKVYESSKLGGLKIPYTPSDYLLRSYKSEQFKPKNLSHLSHSANKVAINSTHKFRWKYIFQSGLYYRISQYEKNYGLIKDDFQALSNFFICNQKNVSMRKKTLAEKYAMYEEFKSLM